MQKDNIVWISVPGGVVGMNLDYLNSKIDYYNKSEYLVKYGSFWEWLSWEEGEIYKGLSYWQKDTSKIHSIRRRYDHVN